MLSAFHWLINNVSKGFPSVISSIYAELSFCSVSLIGCWVGSIVGVVTFSVVACIALLASTFSPLVCVFTEQPVTSNTMPKIS